MCGADSVGNPLCSVLVPQRHLGRELLVALANQAERREQQGEPQLACCDDRIDDALFLVVKPAENAERQDASAT